MVSMKKGILFSILLIICLFPLLSVIADELTDDYFDIAVNYFNEKDYKSSMNYLNDVLALDPCDLKANTLRNKILPLLTNVERQALFASKLELLQVFQQNLDYNYDAQPPGQKVECR